MNIAVDVTLDVACRYRELVEEALSGDSVYIRVKETLQDIFDEGNITSGDKAQVLTNVLGQLNASVTTGAMQTALQWEAQQKQLELQKLKLAYELALLKAQADAAEIAVDTELAKKQNMQAQTLRVYGTHTVNASGDVLSLNDNGQIYEQILGYREDVLNKEANTELLVANKEQTLANVHKTVADAYVNYGIYNGYTITEQGITGVSEVSTHKTLSDYQANVAAVQAKGYAYNAWANAAQSASSMIGVLLSSENESALTPSDVALWRTAVTNLNAIPVPSI